MGQQGVGRATMGSAEMGVQSPFEPMAGSPLALHNGGGAGPVLTPQLMGGSALPLNYGAGVGGAGPLPIAAKVLALPNEAAAQAVNDDDDAWLSKYYTLPPVALAQTIEFIALDRPLADENVQSQESFEFFKSVRVEFQRVYARRGKTNLTAEAKTRLQYSPLFTLLKHATGAFTGDQERFLIAAKFICHSHGAATQLLSCLTDRKSKKLVKRSGGCSTFPRVEHTHTHKLTLLVDSTGSLLPNIDPLPFFYSSILIFFHFYLVFFSLFHHISYLCKMK